MYRHRDYVVACAIVLSVGLRAGAQSGSAARHDEVLSQFLESLGAQALLAQHLEQRLVRARGDSRDALAQRLVELYGRMLDGAGTRSEREELDRRSRDLLDLVPEAASAQLRLDLARSLYDQIEVSVGRWRIGQATAEEIESSIGTLTTLASELHELGLRSDRDAVRLQRDEEQAPIEQRAILSQRLEQARRRRSIAFYLAGWSNLSLAEMTGTQHNAQEALREFGWLLGAELRKAPVISRLNRGLLHYEHIARAALGTSVCYSVMGKAGESVAWLDMLEREPGLAPIVKSQLPTWRIVVLGRARAFDDLRTDLQRLRWDASAQEILPLTTGQALLLLETIGSSGGGGQRSIGRERAFLRDIALDDLLAQGSVREFARSVERFGAEGFGEGTFGAGCAVGLPMYFRVRERGVSANSLDQSVQASRLLRDAINAQDAGRYVRAIGPVTLAAGVSLRDASLWELEHRPRSSGQAGARLVEASGLLAQASAVLADEDAEADALWLAVRSLDDARVLGGVQIDAAQREALVGRFFARYPDHPNASALLATEAEAQETSDEMIARLSNIPPDSPAFDAARRKVAQQLFEQFRASSSLDKEWAAQRYVEAAEAIVFDDAKLALGGDAEAASRAMVRGQRLLAALFGVVQPDVVRAQRVLAVLREILEGGLVGDGVATELLFREGQLAIARDRGEEAGAIRERLAAREEGDAGGLLASFDQALFRRAVVRWQDAARQGEIDSRLALEVIATGRRVLGQHGIEWPVLVLESGVDARVLSQVALCAEAAYDAGLATGDSDVDAASYSAHKALRDAGVTDPDVLSRLAQSAERGGDVAEAIETWQVLASGVERAETGWFEARYHIMRLVAMTDRAQAAVLLGQHISMYPELGPSPWDERLGELAAELGVSIEGGGGS